jgi:hypothetical protein
MIGQRPLGMLARFLLLHAYSIGEASILQFLATCRRGSREPEVSPERHGAE